MADIGKALKDEIARIAKREANSLLSVHIKTIRGLKREFAALKKQMPKPVRQAAATAPGTAGDQPSGRNRWFTGGGVKGLRMRLKLSQADFARLCGVSANAVGLWENAKPGKLNLRSATREALTKVRAMSPAGVRKALG